MPPSPDPESTSASLSKAGIAVTADGQRVIPSSLRADGSARREIRVRPGYRPPEDVEIYKNRNAEAWKNRGSGGVPGADPVEKPDSSRSDASNKNAKRKAARKKAKEKEQAEGVEELATTAKEPPATDPAPKEAPSLCATETTPEEKEKQAKAIRKKIRQANDLKNRKDGGQNLLPEQLEKVVKLHELVRQLNALGFEQ